jgi:hypothetical protein
MSSKVERKLAAIMFTDIVGYTEQMSRSEASHMKKKFKTRFLNYPGPKAIVEEYNKVFKNNN